MPFQRSAATLLIIAMVVAACILPVGARGDQTKAKVFIQVAEKAMEIAVELIERAKADGKEVSPAVHLVDEGSNLLARAKAAYDRGDYDSAAAEAKLAQERFRDALRALGPERPSIDEREATARLLEAIKRARERIQGVRDALTSSAEIGGNLREQISSKLSQAERLLDDAESILKTNAKNASEAARRLAQAEKLISEAYVMLKHASHEPNKHRIDAFLKNLERDISKLIDELTKLKKRGVKVDDLIDLLNRADSLVRSARDKATGDDLDGALTDIQQARDITQQVRREIAKRHKP